MNRRLGLFSGVARHGIFSALVGPRILLAPEGGEGGGSPGGEGGGAAGAGGGADAAAATTEGTAKPEGSPSALAGAVKDAAAKPEGEAAKPEGAEGKVEGADKVRPADEERPEDKPKAAEEQAAENAKPKDIDGNPLPEKYEVKMPDGVEMDADLMAIAAPVFAEHRMSPAQAQAVTDLYVKTQEKAIAAHIEQTNKWLDESKKDKEIGGKDYEKNLGHAARAFQAFGSERLMQIMDTYGLGNNPEVLRVFARMGKALGEGSTVLPGAEHGDVSTASVMYPSMNKKS